MKYGRIQIDVKICFAFPVSWFKKACDFVLLDVDAELVNLFGYVFTVYVITVLVSYMLNSILKYLGLNPK